MLAYLTRKNSIVSCVCRHHDEALDALQQDIYLLEADNAKLKQNLKAVNIKSMNNEEGKLFITALHI